MPIRFPLVAEGVCAGVVSSRERPLSPGLGALLRDVDGELSGLLVKGVNERLNCSHTILSGGCCRGNWQVRA